METSSAGCCSYHCRRLHMLLQAQPWRAEGEPLVAKICGSRLGGRWTWCASYILYHAHHPQARQQCCAVSRGTSRPWAHCPLILGWRECFIYTSMYCVLGCWIPMHGKNCVYTDIRVAALLLLPTSYTCARVRSRRCMHPAVPSQAAMHPQGCV
jgi:hypothetical protein